MNMRQRPVDLRCYPRDDEVFGLDARSMLVDCRASVGPADDLIAEFERKLRESFPRARVRARDPLAEVEPETNAVWYCYRDGSLLG